MKCTSLPFFYLGLVVIFGSHETAGFVSPRASLSLQRTQIMAHVVAEAPQFKKKTGPTKKSTISKSFQSSPKSEKNVFPSLMLAMLVALSPGPDMAMAATTTSEASNAVPVQVAAAPTPAKEESVPVVVAVVADAAVDTKEPAADVSITKPPKISNNKAPYQSPKVMRVKELTAAGVKDPKVLQRKEMAAARQRDARALDAKTKELAAVRLSEENEAAAAKNALPPADRKFFRRVAVAKETPSNEKVLTAGDAKFKQLREQGAGIKPQLLSKAGVEKPQLLSNAGAEIPAKNQRSKETKNKPFNVDQAELRTALREKDRSMTTDN